MYQTKCSNFGFRDHSFVHLANPLTCSSGKHLMHTSFVPGTAIVAEDTKVTVMEYTA